MESALGWSELLILGVLAALLLDTRDLRRLFALARDLRIRLHRFRFELEEALSGEGVPMSEDPRARMRALLRALPPETRARESGLLLEKLRTHPLLSEATCIAAFHPSSSEPDITPWLSELASQGRLLLPRVLPDRKMEFVEVRDLKLDLVSGAFGLREPRPDLPASPREPMAFLVPGVLFGTKGERMGHGAGYYDRYLASYPLAPRIGICYSVQIQKDGFKPKPHDILMDEVLSA